MLLLFISNLSLYIIFVLFLNVSLFLVNQSLSLSFSLTIILFVVFFASKYYLTIIFSLSLLFIFVLFKTFCLILSLFYLLLYLFYCYCFQLLSSVGRTFSEGRLCGVQHHRLHHPQHPSSVPLHHRSRELVRLLGLCRNQDHDSTTVSNNINNGGAAVNFHNYGGPGYSINSGRGQGHHRIFRRHSCSQLHPHHLGACSKRSRGLSSPQGKLSI